jgi:6-pyruvoyltetrahydropterin/6-carboxytetrahydropterin synthase
MLITRRAEFSASHICYNPELPEQTNRDLYGESAGSHGHGHNFVFEVTLEGEPDPVTGMIIDLKLVKDILNREVVEVMDHRHLNFEVPPFDSVVPTAENIAKEIWRRLEPHLSRTPVRLRQVRLWETEELFVDYSGED